MKIVSEQKTARFPRYLAGQNSKSHPAVMMLLPYFWTVDKTQLELTKPVFVNYL